MNQENPVHVMLNYSEAKNSRRDLLSSQINLLELKRSLVKYKTLRVNELRKKEKLTQKMKGVKADLSKLGKLLPKIKPSGGSKVEKESRNEISKKKLSSPSLEQELNEIRLKLKKLEE